ncbi:hypothetical protein DCAR_0101685 [Daucus carota subsp. sativus]|uniref:Disease resistance R13L4/SHOC-2-like LRR domain-containing protein n=1 Tax=Daucus carota subsp. sativus TaxID=79200 RepID=A0AAF0W3G6_DAUCS|nr:PREDICTED: probable disease resistance protein At4g27220 [Daucus carota subsp. sativus]WOG82520.1 hypothetical protein DCAR_0101685 [Daucus carota subsp. sativus]
MPNLRVLDLSSTSIKTSPLSVSNLIKLRELLLRNCELLMELPHEIGALGNLKVLDLEGTYLACLPKEVGELNKLRCLKDSLYDAVSYRKSKRRVNIIPRTILAKFTQLVSIILIEHKI